MSSKAKTPRGIRNNNPLNIRVGNNWKGEVSKPTDHTFEQFAEMKWGVRAAFIVLNNYISRHKLNTIAKIIQRWAPNNENNTKRYIETVSVLSKIDKNEAILFENTCKMISLFQAMCFVENGEYIPLEDVLEGYILAEKSIRKTSSK